MNRDRRKRVIAAAIAVLLLLGTMAAQSSSQPSGQSLGDAARAARQKKAQSEPAVRHYDNDNLPTGGSLSVVGPAPSATTAGDQRTDQTASAADSRTPDPNALQRQQAADDAQKKIETQQAKIDQLAHELDLDQREYRLRAAAFYSDAGNRLRDATQWDKDDARYKSEIEAKQKALDDAKAQLPDLQEAARKAGVKEKEKDSDKENKDTDKDK